MKKVFQTATGIFGGGTPLVCVPIVAGDQDGIWKKAEEIRAGVAALTAKYPIYR